MNDHAITFGHAQSVLIAKRVRQASYEIEQPVAADLDVQATLDVSIRSETRRRRIVTLVE
jgi:hypothetical protein